MSLPVVVSLVWMAFVERPPRGVRGTRLVAARKLPACGSCRYGRCRRTAAVLVGRLSSCGGCRRAGAVSGGGGGWW
jgi:hypothetical protein